MSGHRAGADPSILAAAEALSDAFAARDVDAALACFVADDAIGYTGSERGEQATGRRAVRSLLTGLFARDEAYAWRITTAVTHAYDACAYLIADADGLVRTDGGDTETFAYRVSGLLEPVPGGWRWRHCHGDEPTTDG